MNRGQTTFRALKFTFLAALCLFCAVGWAQAAATVYVDAVNGNDINAGTTSATAKQTIQADQGKYCGHVESGSFLRGKLPDALLDGGDERGGRC